MWSKLLCSLIALQLIWSINAGLNNRLNCYLEGKLRIELLEKNDPQPKISRKFLYDRTMYSIGKYLEKVSQKHSRGSFSETFFRQS